MSALGSLSLERPTLPQKRGSNGVRGVAPSWLTLHYNGPSVAGAGNPIAERAQLVADANYHINKIWGYDNDLTPIYGHRIMYDYAVLSDGVVLDLGDPHDLLFHCGNATGNRRSRAVHVPVGGAQDVTDRQWAGVVRLYEALAQDFAWAGRSCLVGHCEWPRAIGSLPIVRNDAYHVQPGQSQCPGAHVMDRVIDYRTARPSPTRLTFHIRADVPVANVRTAPTTASTIAAWQQQPYRLKAGDEVIADAIVTGVAVGTERRWVHLANQLGFVHWSLVV